MKQCCEEYLAEQFGGDKDVIAEIYAEYRNTVEEKLAEIESALATPDWTKLDRAAHAVKGCAFAAGDTEMAETAIAIRHAAQLQSASDAGDAIARLKSLKEML